MKRHVLTSVGCLALAVGLGQVSIGEPLQPLQPPESTDKTSVPTQAGLDQVGRFQVATLGAASPNPTVVVMDTATGRCWTKGAASEWTDWGAPPVGGSQTGPQKGEVVAYVHVARNNESMTRDRQLPDAYEFITLQKTTMEYMKSKSLLTRALRDPSISQLPLIKKQADPVKWLQDELSLKFPGEAEILMVSMSGEEIDQIVKIVDAVVDAYFKEVVEKGVADRFKKEERLRQLVEEKSQQMVRELKDVQRMSEALGIVDPAAAATQNQMLQIQLNTLNNSIFGLRSQLSNLDVEIEKCVIDIQLAQDATAKEARAEEEISKDEKMLRWEDQLSKLDEAIENAKNGSEKENEDPTVQRLIKQKARLKDNIQAHRDTLLKRFSDITELVKVKEFEGKKRALEKHRDSLKEQLATQEGAAAETVDKLKVISRDTADLENKRQKIKTLERVIAKLSDELQQIGLEKYARRASRELNRPLRRAAVRTAIAMENTNLADDHRPLSHRLEAAVRGGGTTTFEPRGQLVILSRPSGDGGQAGAGERMTAAEPLSSTYNKRPCPKPASTTDAIVQRRTSCRRHPFLETRFMINRRRVLKVLGTAGIGTAVFQRAPVG